MVGIRDELGHERLEKFYDYWTAQSPGEGQLPGRQHFDPIDIPQLMPWVYLTDVVRDGVALRFRHRLVGTRVAERVGREATGMYFEELYPPEKLAILAPNYESVVRNGTPHFYKSEIVVPLSNRAKHINYSRLLCPFAGDGKTVNLLAGILVFFSEDGQELPPEIG